MRKLLGVEGGGVSRKCAERDVIFKYNLPAYRTDREACVS